MPRVRVSRIPALPRYAFFQSKLPDQRLTRVQLQVRFGQIKRKYGLDANSPSKKTGDAGDIPSTPTKVTKSRKAPGSGGRGRKVKKAEPERDDDDDEAREVKEKSEMPPEPAIKEELDYVVVKSEKPGDGFTLF